MEETFLLNDFPEPVLGWAPWDNCTAPAILDFPYTGLPGGLFGVAISAVVLVYMYAILTAVCNFYLLPTLADIWKGMTVTSDVIGATIMAAAAATPELAISLVSTFWIEGEVGAEAIVGSATFNCLIIPGICAFLTKSHHEKPIDVWPLTRDALMFCISLACLIFCVHGEYVQWYKPFFMVVVYISYVVGMLLEKYLRRKTMMLYYWINEEEEENSPDISLCSEKPYELKTEYYSSCNEADVEYKSRLPGNSSIEKEELFTKLCSWLFWPVTIILYITIPRRYPSLAITISLTWIAVVSYMTTWMIIYIGYNLNIPDSLMALTVLGFGLGIPELLSSMCAAKTGKYTMALCNAFGANTFNILLCLGLPWCIKLLISDNQSIWVNTEGLAYNCALILVIITVIYTSLALNKYVLDKKIGCFFLVLYSIFVVLSTLIEMNVFYPVNLPLCNIKDYYYD